MRDASTIRVRPFRPDDYAAVAAVCATTDDLLDFEFTDADALRAFDEVLALACPVQRYVAEEGGAVIGWAQWFAAQWMPEPSCFWLSARVREDRQRHGAGRQLYTRLLHDLAAHNPAALFVEVSELEPGVVTLLVREGFRERYQALALSLDLARFDPAFWQHYAARAVANGIVITTLADEQQRNPDWLAKLYDLYAVIIRDIPLPEMPNLAPPLAWFRQYISDGSAALPDGCFIAKNGERYIGVSFVHRDLDEPGCLSHKITGVLPEGRGRGVAMALKVKTLEYAVQRGYRAISTWNESHNAEMLAINTRFGFELVPGWMAHVLEKRLEDSVIRDA